MCVCVCVCVYAYYEKYKTVLIKYSHILSWNMTKWVLFFNTISLGVHKLLPFVLQHLDPIFQKVILSNEFRTYQNR